MIIPKILKRYPRIQSIIRKGEKKIQVQKGKEEYRFRISRKSFIRLL